MITHHVDSKNHIIEVTIAGKVSREDINGAIQNIEGPIQEWPEIRVLKRIDSFDGIEWQALVDDLKFAYNNFSNYKKIKKVAVVTEKDWVENLTKIMAPLFSAEVKIFEDDDVEKARTWLA